MTERVVGVINQDRDMIGAMQENYNGAGEDIDEISIVADNAAIRFRRLLIAMVEAEGAS